jgi:hypothetical protein
VSLSLCAVYDGTAHSMHINTSMHEHSSIRKKQEATMCMVCMSHLHCDVQGSRSVLLLDDRSEQVHTAKQIGDFLRREVCRGEDRSGLTMTHIYYNIIYIT